MPAWICEATSSMRISRFLPNSSQAHVLHRAQGRPHQISSVVQQLLLRATAALKLLTAGAHALAWRCRASDDGSSLTGMSAAGVCLTKKDRRQSARTCQSQDGKLRHPKCALAQWPDARPAAGHTSQCRNTPGTRRFLRAASGKYTFNSKTTTKIGFLHRTKGCTRRKQLKMKRMDSANYLERQGRAAKAKPSSARVALDTLLLEKSAG